MKTEKAAKTVSHTPGPWIAESDARLIAAAPDLLEAAKAAYSHIHSYFECGEDHGARPIDGFLRAAIAKEKKMKKNTWYIGRDGILLWNGQRFVDFIDQNGVQQTYMEDMLPTEYGYDSWDEFYAQATAQVHSPFTSIEEIDVDEFLKNK